MICIFFGVTRFKPTFSPISGKLLPFQADSHDHVFPESYWSGVFGHVAQKFPVLQPILEIGSSSSRVPRLTYSINMNQFKQPSWIDGDYSMMAYVQMFVDGSG